MKVTVTVKVESRRASVSTLDLVLSASDTVGAAKERVALLEPIPFPDQALVLDGTSLEDDVQVADAGIKDLSSLDLLVKATDASLAGQLAELLQARDLSCDELGLLYCYKYGASAAQALRLLGHDGTTLQEFVKKQAATFKMEHNSVALLRQSAALKPFSAAAELEAILRSGGGGSMDIKDLCVKFTEKFGKSLSSVVGMKPLEFLAKERQLFALSGRNMVALRSDSSAQDAPTCRRSKVSSLPAAVGLQSPADPQCTPAAAPAGDQEYWDLHNRICSRALSASTSQILSDVVEHLSGSLFLNVDHVVKGGSVGKGTVTSDSADAEVVLFLRGLPRERQERWLPPLLRAAAGALQEGGGDWGISDVRAAEASVRLRAGGSLSVDVRFSPVFGTYAQTVQALAAQGPQASRFYNASLSEERVRFIARQPGAVKATIRLLKWWRGQQNWSGDGARPADDILELLAVYSAVQTRPSDQRMAISNVMSLLSRFDELRIVWSNFYPKEDVHPPLLRQRPLLMDPVNPFVNVADPEAFDSRELMSLAKTTHFFW